MDTSRCDVVVLGAGPAGLSAALVAAREGKAVVLVEATEQLGGNGVFSTGYLAFADTPLQLAAGIEDSPELYVSDLERESIQAWPGHEPVFDSELALRYAEETRHTYRFLVDLGIEFDRFIPRPRQHTRTRMLTLTSPAQFREKFGPALAAVKVTTLLGTRATELLREGDRVVGVTTRSARGDHVLHASSVIVATGGYQASRELRARFAPTIDASAPYPGIDTARGDGHLMMSAAGARLVNMSMIPELVRVASRFVECCIAINTDGRRFHDEAGPYHERLAALNAQPGGTGYYLCDAVAAKRHAQLIAHMPARAELAENRAAVAQLVGASPAVVESTITRWNETVHRGLDTDPEFGRVIFSSPREGIEHPPFSVIPMIGGIATTVGGAAIDGTAHVLDHENQSIPGLFAAGDAVGMLTPATGLGGVHLSSAVTMGRLAGLAA